MSRSEQITAIVAAIATFFLFDHFHLIPSSYEAGRLAAKAAAALGAGMVIAIWSFARKRRRVKQANHSTDPVSTK
jgi:hypothetical protein